jgi:hypothetical protein
MASMLAMILVFASPALAQATATTNAYQKLLQGDLNVSATSAAADQNLFISGGEQSNLQQGNVADLATANVQSQILTGAQAQVPVSAALNLQQVPITAAISGDLDLLLQVQ